MESYGYDLTYVSNQDTHQYPEELIRCRGVLSVDTMSIDAGDVSKSGKSHSEGMHVAFLSGNGLRRIQMRVIPVADRIGS